MKNRTIIGLVIAFLLFLITMFPGILPLSAETVEKMKELRQLHFFIDGSGKMTIAHILTASAGRRTGAAEKIHGTDR